LNVGVEKIAHSPVFPVLDLLQKIFIMFALLNFHEMSQVANVFDIVWLDRIF